MHYRRVRIEGGTYFFTVVTHKRRPIFKDANAVAEFERAVSDVRIAHPFEIAAQVILPDHLHVLWTLPEGDSDFPMRWRMIKAAFTRAMRDDFPDDLTRSKGRADKARVARINQNEEL